MKSVYLLASVIVIQFVMSIAVVLDIMIARQVIAFLYLTFIPGIIVLSILKLQNVLDSVESILFSVGLSIALLMIIGLLINELFPLIGISKPLSLLYLMLVLDIVMIVLCFLSTYINKDWTFISGKNSKLYPFVFLFFALPILSVFGTTVVNAFPHRDNFLLLLMIIVISVLFGLTILSKKLVPNKFYPFVLFTIALSLLFHVSLISNYIHGGDIFGEYFTLKLTQNSSYWSSTASGKLSGMLSLTVLPTIYSSILNLDGSWILKIVYPLIFSLVPVGLYQLYKTQVRKEIAFISAFFFMANMALFAEVATLGRQMIGEFFYVLLFLTIFHKNMNRTSKWICFTIFSFGLVTSHYSTSYIFMFFIFFAWLISFFMKEKKLISLSMVALFATLSFAWYIYISSSTLFDALLGMTENIYTNLLGDFFNPQARGSQVLQGTGAQGLQSSWHLIGRSLFYATEFFIIIGFIWLLYKQKKSFFNKAYNVMMFLNISLLAMLIIVPNFATSFNMTRFYHIQLFFLAPLCILGCETFFTLISKKKLRIKYLTMIIVLILIIPFFLLQTGFVYEVTEDESWSLPLSRYRLSYETLYLLMGVVEEPDAFGAEWLSKYMQPNITSPPIYSGIASQRILVGYGMPPSTHYTNLYPLYNNTRTIGENSYIYLRQSNVKEGIVFGRLGQFNISEISAVLNRLDKVYSNGGCEIYKNSTG